MPVLQVRELKKAGAEASGGSQTITSPAVMGRQLAVLKTGLCQARLSGGA